MDKKALLWNFYNEQRVQGRSFNGQRTSVGNFIIAITGALIVLSTNLSFDKVLIPLAVFIMIISFFGFWATLKLYERQEYHYKRARLILKEIEKIEEVDLFHKIIDDASKLHYKRFRYSKKMPAVIIWLVFTFFNIPVRNRIAA